VSMTTHRITPERIQDSLDVVRYRFGRGCGTCAEMIVNASANKAELITEVKLVCERCVRLDMLEPWAQRHKVYCARTAQEAVARRVALELMS